MTKRGIGWILAATVMSGCAAVFIWQRHVSSRLGRERDALLVQQAALAGLRQANAGLQARATPEAELQKLRSDHDEIARLREKITALRSAGSEKGEEASELPTPFKTEPTLTDDMVASDRWKNLGRASPTTTTETLLWAAAGGDTEVVASMLELSPAARDKAVEIMGKLPGEARERYGTPERLIALLTAKDIPLGEAGILNHPTETEEFTAVNLRLKNPEGLSRKLLLVLRKSDDGWKIYVPPNAVENYGAKLLGLPVPWPEKPWKP